MQAELEHSVVASLDGQDDALFPYLPYLLQDLWEIGAAPDVIARVLRTNRLGARLRTILDLGCGKGAVSVRLAQEFGALVQGIDACPEFIEAARAWAQKYAVADTCRFEVGDIRQRVRELRGYDLAVLGSIGPVFGNMAQTLQVVTPCLVPRGYIVLDDGYLTASSELQSELYLPRAEIVRQIEQSQVEIIDEVLFESEAIAASDAAIYQQIERRALELMELHPEQHALFEGYLQAQAAENTVLENEVVCVTWLLQKRI